MAMKNPPHPGALLKDDIEALNLPVSAVAQALGVTRSQLYRVLSGQSAVSAEMALRLEYVIGGSADHWLSMQSAYDVAQVRKKADEITRGLSRLASPA
ncbi:HigA family addiction module antitoxin [Phyllobacterium zundukense]|uniref:Addiction module antidote protein, HigA family n=1 Tax=Phyllobacterium zundukense TaxID=1867719 RepID=A0A2N9W3W8_9HYPH|nr:HigA family addiction module antitoxin [Phyllobacterium zundukense]ATU92090.1 addiction module antidote protein, HigA family [Phyllobacterium zundukense]PIO46436.1 addiction module antidote protein, HigA family [Phyllobacterium zundukense]